MPRKGKTKAKPHAVPKSRGRKTLLDAAMMKEIEECLKLGNSHKTAYTLAGISYTSFYEYIKRGEAAVIKREKGESLTEDEERYIEFTDTVKKAVEWGKKRHVGIINQVAQGGAESRVTDFYDKNGNVYKTVTEKTPPNFYASAWVLERRYPDEFGKREKVEVDSRVEQKITFDTKQVEDYIKSLPDEELLRIVRDAKRDKEAGEHSDSPGLAH